MRNLSREILYNSSSWEDFKDRIEREHGVCAPLIDPRFRTTSNIPSICNSMGFIRACVISDLEQDMKDWGDDIK